MIKKIIALLLAAVMMLFVLAGCSSNTNNANGTETVKGEVSKSFAINRDVPIVYNPFEYELWTNIYYNEQADRYLNKSYTKTGTFTAIRDEWNEMTRYYVWGYNDNTKCCDWMWEINPDSLKDVPSVGSIIKIKGDFVANDNALDFFWLDNVELIACTEYNGESYDIDCGTMGGTLEMVQLTNVLDFSERFAGKSIYAYGRVLEPNLS